MFFWQAVNDDPMPSREEMLAQANEIANAMHMRVQLSDDLQEDGTKYPAVAIALYSDFDPKTGRMIIGGDWRVVKNDDAQIVQALSEMCWIMNHMKSQARVDVVDPSAVQAIEKATTPSISATFANWSTVIPALVALFTFGVYSLSLYSGVCKLPF